MNRVAPIAISLTAFFAVFAPAAMANEICDGLWFSRNRVLDQAGYCFGSPLGQAQFDNSDCSGQQVTLPPAQTAYVNEIRRLEASFGCSVDTDRTTLDLPDLALRERLDVQPTPYEGDNMEGWGCLGYVGPQVALHAGPNASSALIGRIDPGDWVSVGGYVPIEGWAYATTHGSSWGALRSGGWMPAGQTMRCESEAG